MGKLAQRARRFEIQQQPVTNTLLNPVRDKVLPKCDNHPSDVSPPLSNNSGLVQVVLFAAREHDMVVEYACIRGSEVLYCIVPPEPKHHPRVFPHYLYNTRYIQHTQATGREAMGVHRPLIRWAECETPTSHVQAFPNRSFALSDRATNPRPVLLTCSVPSSLPALLKMGRWGHAGFGSGLHTLP